MSAYLDKPLRPLTQALLDDYNAGAGERAKRMRDLERRYDGPIPREFLPHGLILATAIRLGVGLIEAERILGLGRR